MKTILVTGSNGQLGKSLQSIEERFGLGNDYVYLSSAEMDVTDRSRISEVIVNKKPEYIINCAAYTAVDKAESEQEKAYAINAESLKSLAELCNQHGVTLIHISTDFVFGETSPVPLREDMETAPVNIYGLTKLKGEQFITEGLHAYFIIRTSWLYSEFGNNFLKTMLRLGKERSEISVVYDQVGTPTYALDLAKFIFHIVNSGSRQYGTYHYSNEGVASWYDFAFEIFRVNGTQINLEPITSEKYPTMAKRPKYSLMSKEKVKQNFGIEIRHWTLGVKECMKNYKS
jgi:dTDP-4-dehydrorhamnose reductase